MPRMKRESRPIDENDAPRDDIETARREFTCLLAQVVARQTGRWQRCPRRECRRARGCKTRDGACAMRERLPPRSPQQDAWLRAQLARLLKDPESFRAKAQRHTAANAPSRRRGAQRPADKSDQDS